MDKIWWCACAGEREGGRQEGREKEDIFRLRGRDRKPAGDSTLIPLALLLYFSLSLGVIFPHKIPISFMRS
jgi:hypothetical protein